MRVLSAIVGPQALPVDAAETKVSTRTAIGSQLVGHDQRGPYPVPLQEFLHQLRGDLGVSSSLDHKVQDLTLVVDCTPEPMLLASDEHGHLIEMPMITGLRASPPEVGRDRRAEFQDPAAHRLVRHIQASFGEHLLDVTAEVSWAGAPDAVAHQAVVGTGYSDDTTVDPTRSRVFLRSSSTGSLIRVNTATMTEEARRPLAEIWPSPNPVHLDGVVDGRGNLYLAANATSNRIIKVDGDSLSLVADVAAGADLITLEMLTLYDLTGRVDLLLSIGFLGVDTRVFRTEDLSLFWTGPNVAQRPRGVLAGKIAFGRCEAWVIASPSTTLGAATASVQIRRIVIEPPLFKDPVSGDTPGLSYTDVTLTAAELGLASIVAFAPCYDEANDRIVFIVTDGVGGPRHLVSYAAGSGVVWQTPIDANENLPVRGRFPFEQIWLFGGEQVRTRSTDDGSLLFSQSGFPASVGELRFDPQTSVFYTNSGSNLCQIVAGRGSNSTVALADVVTALCGRVGLVGEDLDVAELTDEILGFGIARQVSVRGALELLAATYAFEGVESDHKLKFKKRGRSVSRVLSEDDLVPLSERETFGETRAQEVDLPLRFSVRYQDADLDADEGTQTAKRIAGPDATMASHNEATLDLPITLTATQAMTVALRQLYGAWLERVMHEWQTDWTHLDLEPGDVLQIALNDGSLFDGPPPAVRSRRRSCAFLADRRPGQLELLRSRRWRRWGSTICRASNRSARRPGCSCWTSRCSATWTTCNGWRRDFIGRQGAYADPPWRAAMLFAGDDGAVYAAADESLQAAPWGIARDALPDTDIPFQTDRDTKLRVSTISGALTSMTELAMLNGANRAAFDPRRRRGRDHRFPRRRVGGRRLRALDLAARSARHRGVHRRSWRGGCASVLLDGAAVVRRAQPLRRIGDTLWHRIVGRGGELRDAPDVARPLLGRDLMPYAPVHLQASGSWGSDITLSWRRRTRIGGALVDGTGVVPLAEDAEAYEVEILDGPGGAVLRTAAVSETSFVYTTAMQGSDFGAAQTGLTLRAYQISAQVGRGFAGEATLEIP